MTDVIDTTAPAAPTLRTPAVVAGVGILLISILAGLANFGAVEALATDGDATKTALDIVASEGSFRLAIAAFVLVAALDAVVAWGPTLAELASPRAADAPDDRPTTASTRTTVVLVGLLFLTATAAFITANALNVGVLNRPDFLTGAAADTPVLATGALLVLGQVGVVGIAALMFPLLKRYGEALAPAHVGFRVTELAASQALPRGPVAGDRTRNRAAQRHHRRLRIDEFELLLPIWLLAKGFAFARD